MEASTVADPAEAEREWSAAWAMVRELRRSATARSTTTKSMTKLSTLMVMAKMKLVESAETKGMKKKLTRMRKKRKRRPMGW